MAIAALIFKSDSFYIARIWNFRQKEKGWVQQHWPWNKKEIFFLGKKEKKLGQSGLSRGRKYQARYRKSVAGNILGIGIWVNWFHFGGPRRDWTSSMFYFLLLLLRAHSNINFIAHKKALMFQNKTHLAILAGTLRRWCNENKQINISLPRMDDSSSEINLQYVPGKRCYIHNQLYITFANTRDALWYRSCVYKVKHQFLLHKFSAHIARGAQEEAEKDFQFRARVKTKRRNDKTHEIKSLIGKRRGIKSETKVFCWK